MIKSAKEIVAAGLTQEVVDMAIETNRQVTALVRELDVLKSYIRDLGAAAAARSGENNALVEGILGSAQVAMVKATPKARKGTDLSEVAEGTLPADVFSALFIKKTVVEFSPDFEEKLNALPLSQRAMVSYLVEIVESKPRVNLPK